MGAAFAISKSTAFLKVSLFISVLLASAGVIAYWNAMFVSIDAQNALIFLFMPLYQLAIALIVFIGAVAVRLKARAADSDSLKTDAAKPRDLG